MSDNAQEVITAKDFTPGEIVTGTIVSVDDKKVSVQLAGGIEGIIPIRELSVLHIQHPSEVVQVGEEVRVAVVKVDEEAGTVVLSKRNAEAPDSWERMKSLYDKHEAFDVTVNDVVKGGLVTDVGVRGFIPASLVDREFVEDLNVFKGTTIRVRVAEIDPENNKLILSRKAVQLGEQRDENVARLRNLQAGDVLEGVVQRLANFGAFVDIGGVDGLVHISELSRHHVAHPSDVVKEGDRVQVKVLGVDPEQGKVSLSMRAVEPDPWSQAVGEFREGQVVTGKVVRLADFGAFVELMPGVDGLVHVSQISNQHVEKPSDALRIGDEVQVKILSVDASRKRISLSIKDAQSQHQRREVQRFAERQQDTDSDRPTLGDLFGDLFKR